MTTLFSTPFQAWDAWNTQQDQMRAWTRIEPQWDNGTLVGFVVVSCAQPWTEQDENFVGIEADGTRRPYGRCHYATEAALSTASNGTVAVELVGGDPAIIPAQIIARWEV